MNYREQQVAMLQSIEDGFRAGRAPSTLVPMSRSYAEDEERCLTNVVFVPELEAHPAYQQMIKELSELNEGHYLYPEHALHTTIKNVRTVHAPPLFTEDEIERIRPVLREVATRYQSFEIDWQGLLALPTSLAIKGFSSEVYGQLVTDLHQALIDTGVPDNKSYVSSTVFANSVTFCRYTHQPSQAWNNIIHRWKNEAFGTTHIKSFSLIVCNAVVAPTSLRVIEAFLFKD